MLQDDLQAGPALSRINSEGDMEEGNPLPCLLLHPLCSPLTPLTALPSALPSALPLSQYLHLEACCSCCCLLQLHQKPVSARGFMHLRQRQLK